MHCTLLLLDSAGKETPDNLRIKINLSIGSTALVLLGSDNSTELLRAGLEGLKSVVQMYPETMEVLAAVQVPCPALPCPALPCPALPYPALPCPALPCPCPALPCPALSKGTCLDTACLPAAAKLPYQSCLTLPCSLSLNYKPAAAGAAAAESSIDET